MNFEARQAAYKRQVEDGLNALAFEGTPDRLRQAMRYSLLSGGKRVRGVLALAACDMAGGETRDAMPFALGVEMIHAYSLIHDDLPAMDNDTLRRGKPTSHVVYGEATAILAGDGLLTEAFRVMSACRAPGALAALSRVALAAGSAGMVGGQVLDMEKGAPLTGLDAVKAIHARKTGCMMTAPVEAGLIVAGADADALAAGQAFARHLGVAFQVVDDVLDTVGDENKLGKHLHKDVQEDKMTWVRAVGLEQARRDARTETAAAVAALAPFGGKADFLRAFAQSLMERAF